MGSGAASGVGSCSEVARFPPFVPRSELVGEVEKVNGEGFPDVTGLRGVFPSGFVPGISPKQLWLASHLLEGDTSSALSDIVGVG